MKSNLMVGRDVVCRPRRSAEPNTTGNDRTPSLETPMLRIVRSHAPWDKPTRLSLRLNLSHFQKVSNASASNVFIFLRPLSSPPGVPWLTECEFCEAKLQLLAHWHREGPGTISCLPVDKFNATRKTNSPYWLPQGNQDLSQHLESPQHLRHKRAPPTRCTRSRNPATNRSWH